RGELRGVLSAHVLRPPGGRLAHDRRGPTGCGPPRIVAPFLAGQVVGFYDPDTGRLVYQRSGALGLEERFVLAHELTHAIDDQHFDLSRLDGLARSCADEASSAALGAVEGSAQYFATQVIARNPSTDLG